MTEDPFYLIRRSHLPEVLKRTTQVSELLEQNPGLSVLLAVRQVGISRSAYYKYKNVVKPFYTAVEGQMITISLTLHHEAGILSEVLNTLATLRANILTINQSLPLQGMATVIISIETRDMQIELTDALTTLTNIKGVDHVIIVGQS